MGDYGMKVAKTGKSITSTNPRDYRFHSGINMLKIFKEAFGSKSVSTGVVGTIDVTHNLGYKPIVLSYFKHPSDGHWYSAPCRTFDYETTFPNWDLMSVMKHINNNQIQIKLYDGDPPMPTSPTSINYKYYILADPRENDWYEPATSDTDEETYSDDYGFKISRPGIDVKTAEPKNLVFSTSFNTFKEYRIIKMTSEGSITHGLDYPPTFLALKEDYFNPGEFIRGDAWPFINGSAPMISIDDTKVYYRTGGYEDIYVILFIDPLDE
jgi:hypothetical protein